MAPGQSLLPIRRDRRPPMAFPPLLAASSTNLPTSSLGSSLRATAAPPATPGRSMLDYSRFDLDGLLGDAGQGDGSLLFNESGADWLLADHSAFTVAARTPAKAPNQVLGDSPLQVNGLKQGEDDEDDEDEVVLAAVPQEHSTMEQQELALYDESPPCSPSASLLDPVIIPAAAPLTVTDDRGIDNGGAEGDEEPSLEVEEPLSPAPPLPTAQSSPSFAARDQPPASSPPAISAARSTTLVSPQAAAGPTTAPHARPVPNRHRPSLAPLPQAGPALSMMAALGDLPESHVTGGVEDGPASVAQVVPDFDAAQSPVPAHAQPAHSPVPVTAVPLLRSPPSLPVASTSAPGPLSLATEPPAPVSALSAPANSDPSANSGSDEAVTGPAAPPQPSTSRPPPPRPAVPARPAHLLPKNHPAHPRKSLAASLIRPDPAPLPSVSGAAPKKRAEDKGVKSADEDARRRVREAKEERERKARERREKAEKAAREQAEARRSERAAADEASRAKKALASSQVKADAPKVTPVAEEPVEPAQAATEAPPFSPPASIEPLADPPVFAFDADSSLPAMGAPLDFVTSLGLDTELLLPAGVAGGRSGVTSTPARPVKRKMVEEEDPPRGTGQAQPMPQEAQVKKRARRSTLAVPSAAELVEAAEPETLPPAQVKEEEVDETVDLPAATKQPRRRPSRVSLAGPAPSVAALSAPVALVPTAEPLLPRPSKGKAVRVSLLPPLPDDKAASRASLSASTSSASLSRSQRRVSRVSFALAPGESAPAAVPLSVLPEEAAAEQAISSTSTGSARSTSGRRASRISLAPVPSSPPRQEASPVEQHHAETLPQAINANRLHSSTRRASRLFVPIEEEPTPVASTSSLPPVTATALPLSDHATSAAAVPFVEPRPKPKPTVVGGVTLPASFSFAASSAERDAERQHRLEERERREKAAEEAVLEKKRKRELSASAWAIKPDEGIKRIRLADDLAPKAAPQIAEAGQPGATIEHDFEQPAPRQPGDFAAAHPHKHRPRRSHAAPRASPDPSAPRLPPSEPASAAFPADLEPRAPMFDDAHPIAEAESAEPVQQALTREALERNTRRAGPAANLERRVSRFLESIGEASEDVSCGGVAPTFDERDGGIAEEFAEAAAIVDVDLTQTQPTHALLEEPPHSASAVAHASTQAPAAPPAPKTRPSTVTASTAAKPFNFSTTSRAARAPLAPTSGQVASPMFTSRLSSWKAREAAVLSKAGSNAGGERTRKALAAAAPPAKRAKIAVQDKENVGPAPAPRSAPSRSLATKQPASGGVAAELEKMMRERMDWSERQKRREEEVKRQREKMRADEADREREKLKQLRASLAARSATSSVPARAKVRARVV
ncbi:uncharacterized protein JCM10292_001756 [Rhodotorula paludigena]|uniref:uncharacterized protein n=1 Tax=Rhodotorula paludigena TaxID=86838 RepID=UPI0031826A77